MLKDLLYVTAYVSDQRRSLTFYTEQLGLEKRIDAQGSERRFLTVAPRRRPSRSSSGRMARGRLQQRNSIRGSSCRVRSSSNPTT